MLFHHANIADKGDEFGNTMIKLCLSRLICKSRLRFKLILDLIRITNYLDV